MMDLEEYTYQSWKRLCIESIEKFSHIFHLSKVELVEFAYKHYPEEYRKDGALDRLHKELLEELS